MIRQFLVAMFLLCWLAKPLCGYTEPLTDTARQKPLHNGIYTESYILGGSGRYSQTTAAYPAAGFGLKVAYRYGHFYVNAGLGVLSMKQVPYDNYIYYSNVSNDRNRFLVQLPMGVGVNLSRGTFTMQAGVDFPYMAEVNLTAAENGFAVSPYLSFTWDLRRKKMAIGFLIKSVTNLQQTETDIYNPHFLGLGLLIRNY